MKNPYDILGVKKNATEAEIKRAYRKLSKEHHPDKTGADAKIFIEINRAYEILIDPLARQKFDETGEIDGEISDLTNPEQLFVAKFENALKTWLLWKAKERERMTFSLAEIVNLHKSGTSFSECHPPLEWIKGAVRDQLIEERDKKRKDLKTAHELAKKLDGIKGKVKHSGDNGRNLVNVSFAKMERDLKSQAEAMEGMIRFYDEAILISDQYIYENHEDPRLAVGWSKVIYEGSPT